MVGSLHRGQYCVSQDDAALNTTFRDICIPGRIMLDQLAESINSPSLSSSAMMYSRRVIL